MLVHLFGQAVAKLGTQAIELLRLRGMAEFEGACFD